MQSIEEDKQTRKRSNAHKIPKTADSSSTNLEEPKVVQMGGNALIQVSEYSIHFFRHRAAF